MNNSFLKLYEIINNNSNHDIFHVDTKYIMKCCDEFEKDYAKYLRENNVKAYEKYIKKDNVKDTCEHCKKEFDFGDLSSISNKLYCYNCANGLFHHCYKCNIFIDIDNEPYYDYADKKICNDCYKRYYGTCHHCDAVVCDYDLIDDKVVCDDCRRKYYARCTACGYYIDKNTTVITAYDDIICKDCYYSQYFNCEDCNNIYHLDNEYCYHGQSLCPSCYADHHCNIHSYDYKPDDINFYGSKDRENNLHVGIELEIQGNGKDDFIETMIETYDDNMFYLKEDGSLDDDYGVEIVSHPMTYEFMMNNTDWYNVFRYMEKYNMDDINNAGLHFHLDKAYFSNENISVIDYIVNNFSDYFSKLGGRNFDHFSRYCKKVNKNIADWGLKVSDESRYQAVNLTNSSTIELRFCQSTSDFETFINRVKMIFAIADFSKKYSLKDVCNYNKDDFDKTFTNFMNTNFFKD